MAAPQFPPLPHSDTFMSAAAITMPGSGDLVLAVEANGLMVGTAGAVAVILTDGDVVVLPALQVGVQYKQRLKGFRVTGTTATGIVALY